MTAPDPRKPHDHSQPHRGVTPCGHPVCLLCGEPAAAVCWLDAGCVAWPGEQYQPLCLHHFHRATPLGGMVVLEDFRE